MTPRMKNPTRLFALLSLFCLLLPPRIQAGALGADVNADVDAFGHSQMDSGGLRTFAAKNTLYALPLFNQPDNDHARYWDNMVEQYQSAQIDFIAVWLKGNNQPATFGHCVTAGVRRGLTDRLKIMPFDDNPASWTALWNFDHGNGCNYKVPSDVSKEENWAYVWDKNLEVFFKNVPDANRYKIQGRPVYTTWNTDTWHGVTLGTCIPQFHISANADPNSPTWLVDPRHGKVLSDGLLGTAGNAQCLSTFIEGFDDYWENTTLWRARNLDENGHALGYAQTYYDYPNQRINLVRRLSSHPFPADLKEKAEGCDDFSGAAALRTRPSYYRNGPIAIEDTTDTCGGYDVRASRVEETLRWLEVPIQDKVHLRVHVATTSPGRELHFVLDGIKHPTVTLTNTGGSQIWATVDMGAYTFAPQSCHTVSLVSNISGVNVNWWQAGTGK